MNKIYYLNRSQNINKQSNFKIWFYSQSKLNVISYGGMIGIWIIVLVEGISG